MPVEQSSLPSLRGDGAALPSVYVIEVSDREDSSKVRAHVIVEECEEVSEHRGKVYEAKLNVHCEVLTEGRDWREGDTRFSGAFSIAHERVSLISASIGGDGLFNDLPDLRGQRVGTFLFSRVVAWAKRWEGMQVMTIRLGGNRDADNIARRNRMYEQAGIRFAYQPGTNSELGDSLPIKTDELVVVDTWKSNIRVLTLTEYISGLRANVSELRNDVRRLEGVREYYKEEKSHRESKPFRWALAIHGYALLGRLMSPFAVIVYVAAGVTFSLLRHR